MRGRRDYTVFKKILSMERFKKLKHLNPDMYENFGGGFDFRGLKCFANKIVKLQSLHPLLQLNWRRTLIIS
jgi:hypothetical protein